MALLVSQQVTDSTFPALLWFCRMPPTERPPARVRVWEGPQRLWNRSPLDLQQAQVQQEVVDQAPPDPHKQITTLQATTVTMFAAQNKRMEDFMNSFNLPSL